ncbi:hypothetical protein BDV39DRAFT_210808 [Aspergillus sergii]|uniref:Uncharacterized protein n=1 Tax=Aspergillus sergii TaxID=1034303 RepID=A0A5N6WPE0_9EURO|nr:hypothetical protein BDV39DRAFT_210808 [Aspergillus sergii]
MSLHFEGSLRWMPHRFWFKFESGGAAFEARTDGYLKDHRTGNVIGIVEVKAGLRSSDKSIRMQESAEMVAWITSLSHAPKDLPSRSFIVSEDRHKIYVTFAEYGVEYLRYLKGRPYTGDPFLVMHEYGPWDIERKDHMRMVGALILGLVIRAREDHDGELDVPSLIASLSQSQNSPSVEQSTSGHYPSTPDPLTGASALAG